MDGLYGTAEETFLLWAKSEQAVMNDTFLVH